MALGFMMGQQQTTHVSEEVDGIKVLRRASFCLKSREMA